ncbi:N4-gp56 family major capsid protein [Paenibacillus alba]|uniref:N4-gp56 family major capsid protein n=1 Tax=Paenibacillus alba TaxID=1197127 RepID=A0ABU6GEI7_9BACL|nr:N4-gp56 family major capsid protein [Paenibacillus alba]MEC0231178.1 N4-gp56 family major capsid protein [Paenibacillus alba]
MATNVQGYNTGSGVNQLSAENATFYQTAMLDRLTPELFFMNYGDKKNIPKRKGATANWRRLNNLAVSTTAITEGVTPDGVDLSITPVNATVQVYGNWTKIGEFIDLVGLDPLMTETAELMGENAGQSMDIIVRDIITAGTNVTYANGKASRVTVAAADKITAADILRLRRTMKKNKVKPIKLPDGSMGYLMFVSPDVALDLMQMQEWKDQNTYVNTDNRKNGELGKLYGVYFLEAVNVSIDPTGGAASIPVHLNLMIGAGAYGVPDVEGSSKPEIIVHTAGSSGVADPLNQFNTVAWKSVFTSVILQQLAIIRYECAVST